MTEVLRVLCLAVFTATLLGAAAGKDSDQCSPAKDRIRRALDLRGTRRRRTISIPKGTAWECKWAVNCPFETQSRYVARFQISVPIIIGIPPYLFDDHGLEQLLGLDEGDGEKEEDIKERKDEAYNEEMEKAARRKYVQTGQREHKEGDQSNGYEMGYREQDVRRQRDEYRTRSRGRTEISHREGYELWPQEVYNTDRNVGREVPYDRYQFNEDRHNLDVNEEYETVSNQNEERTGESEAYGAASNQFAQNTGGYKVLSKDNRKVNSRKKKRSLDGLTRSERYSLAAVAERLHIYGVVEGLLNRLGMDGRECLLRTVCEVANDPMEAGLLGDLFNLVLSPSLTAEAPLHSALELYIAAERRGGDGSDGGRCSSWYPSCPVSLLELLPVVVEAVFGEDSAEDSNRDLIGTNRIVSEYDDQSI